MGRSTRRASAASAAPTTAPTTTATHDHVGRIASMTAWPSTKPMAAMATTTDTA